MTTVSQVSQPAEQADEHIVIKLNPSKWTWAVKPTIFLSGAILILVLAFVPLSVPLGLPFLSFFNYIFFQLFALVILLAVVVYYYIRWLKWKYVIYIATNKRILVQTGIFSRNVIEYPIDKIENIIVSRSFLERILGIGTIVFSTEGISDPRAGRGISWTQIPHPEIVERELRAIINK